MNNIAAYTPLESLLLFQSLLSHGIGAAAFVRTATLLKHNPLVKKGATYDDDRLSPESLQRLFLHLLREELEAEPDNTDKPDSGLSPNSKKRKLQPPPLPTLNEARKHIGKVPSLIDRLYARYRDHVVREIRDDEERFDILQEEIRDIERKALDDNKPGAPPPTDKHGTQARHATDVPASGGAQDPGLANGDAQARQPTEPRNEPPQPQPEKPQTPALPLVPPRPTASPVDQPGQVGPGPGGHAHEPTKPTSGTTQVLQPPQGVYPYAPPQAPLPQPSTEGLQRPEGITRPKVSPVPQPLQPQRTGQLKWEPPYQPSPVPTQHRQPHAPGQYPAQKQQPQGSPLPQWSSPVPPPYPGPRPPPPPSPHQAQSAPQTTSAPTQAPGHYVPQLKPAPARSPSEPEAAPPRNITPSLVPAPAHGRQVQPPRPAPSPYPSHPHASPNRPLAAASPATPIAGPEHGSVPSQSRRQPPSAHPPPPHAQPVSSPSPTPNIQGGYSSPYNLPPRPAIPDHILPQQHKEQRLSTATPTQPSRASSIGQPLQTPQTPISVPPHHHTHTVGSGTKWKPTSTPSTPHPGVGDMMSPAYEPLSPVLAPSAPPTVSPEPRPKKPTNKPVKEGDLSVPKPRGRPSRTQRGQETPVTPAPPPLPRANQPANSPTEELHRPRSATIKNEETTPRPPTEAGDTTADEGVPGLRRTSRLVKRKRRESSPPDMESREPPAPPSHVLWTRSFNKVSHSAMEQIISHRSANMFANQIRERDAPGYKTVVLQPQDLKSVRAAMNRGNRAAAAAAAALPGGDPGTSSVWLPICEELVPPKAIINSAQLDRELAHMFSNAIMYNPDPDRGPGPRFMRAVEGDDEEGAEGGPTEAVLGYKVDENGVVNDTRSMFVEVQKLLSDLQSAEIQRGAPPVPATGTNTRQASVVGGLGETPDTKDDPGSAVDDADEHTAVEPENQTSKRRRITRG